MNKSKDLLIQNVPVLEYFDILYQRKRILKLDKEECKLLKGLTRRELQYKIFELLKEKHGNKYSPGQFRYVMKQPTSPKLEHGSIALLSKDDENNINDESVTMDIKEIQKEMNELKSLINKASKDSNNSSDKLLEIQKLGHAQEVKYLEQQITWKQNEIDKLKSDYNSLEKELEAAEKELSDIQQSETITTLVKSLFGGTGKTNSVAPTRLKDESIQSDIPAELFALLFSIDWVRVSPEDTAATMRDFTLYVNAKGFPIK